MKIRETYNKLPTEYKIILSLIAFIFFYTVSNLIGSANFIPDGVKTIIKMIFESIGILCVVLIGSALERRATAEEAANILAEKIASDRQRDFGTLSERIIPASYHFGLKGVIPAFDFQELFRLAEADDEIDISFTYHPELLTFLERAIPALMNKGVKLKMLLAYDRSPDTLLRFHEIAGSRDSLDWAGPSSTHASVISMLGTFIRQQLPAFQRLYPDLQFKVSNHLTDAPFVIVRNTKEDNPRAVRFVWIGFYLIPPAVHMPAVLWRPIPQTNDDTHSCIARETARYFEARWSKAHSVQTMDAMYADGRTWKDEFDRAGVDISQIKKWIDAWTAPMPSVDRPSTDPSELEK